MEIVKSSNVKGSTLRSFLFVTLWWFETETKKIIKFKPLQKINAANA